MAKKTPDKNTQPIMSVRGIDSEGNAPSRRVATVSAALTAYTTMCDAERIGGRDARYACIAGIFAGFPPIPPAEMDRQGMGDMPNMNTREFEASMLDYVDVWNSVNCGNLEWAEVKADHEDPMEAQRRSDYLTKCFNAALQAWDDPPKGGYFNQSGRYIIESATRDLQMGLYGTGIALRRDAIDFRFTTIPTRRFLVPDGTKITLENCPMVCIQDDMSAADLWAMRKQKGWNEKQIARLLYMNQGARTNLTQERSTFAQWVQWVRENESFMLTDFTPVPFIHIYTKEFSGQISHSCFSIDNPQSNTARLKDSRGIPDPDFLYDAPESEWQDTWAQVVSVFADSVGAEGSYHGAKGFGDRNYDPCHFNNLMFNQTARSAIVNNMPVFQSQNEQDRQKLNEVVFTPFAIMMSELPIVKLDMRMDLQGSMAMYDMATRVRNMNNRKFPVGERSRSGEAPTATQVNTDTAKEAQFTGLQISYYRATGLDPLLAESYRRIAQPASKYPESWPGGKVAKRFREMCAEYGIPEEDLLKVTSVRASRQGGSGSMSIDVMKAEKALTVATPGKGQWNAKHELAVALYGADMANAIVEPIPDDPTPVDREINNENLFIQDGKAPLVLPTDPHEVHVPAHVQILAALQQVVMQFQQQGITPDNIDDAILLKGKVDAGIEHTGSHLQYMMQLPTGRGQKGLYENIVKETTKILKDLSAMSVGFGEDIQKAASEAQQQQAQQTPERMLAEEKIKILWATAQAQIEIDRAKAETNLGTKAVAAEAKTEMKKSEHEMKLGLQAEQALAAQQQAAALNSQNLQAGAAQTIQQLEAKQAEAHINVATTAAQAAINLDAEKKKAELKTESKTE